VGQTGSGSDRKWVRQEVGQTGSESDRKWVRQELGHTVAAGGGRMYVWKASMSFRDLSREEVPTICLLKHR